MFQDAPRCSRTFHAATGRSRTFQDAIIRPPGCSGTLQDGARRSTHSKTLQGGRSRLLQNTLERSRRLQNAPRRSRTLHNAPGHSRTLQDAPGRFRIKVFPYGLAANSSRITIATHGLAANSSRISVASYARIPPSGFS